MQFFEDMNDKCGFSDGEATPDGVGEYREVYLRAINAYAEKHGSQQRMIAWDRPGVHNGCLVLEVTREYFESLKSDAERYTAGPTKFPPEAHTPQSRDVGLEQAIEDANDADLDQFVNVQVNVAMDELNALLSGGRLPVSCREEAGTAQNQNAAATQGFADELRKAIVDILLANGESVLDDHGVDKKICDQVAGEIIERLQRQPLRVLVAIRGGCVQGALADLPNITLTLYDYDVFDSEPRDDQGRTKEEAEEEWDEARTAMQAIF